MIQPKLLIIAGPNGSGKTTVTGKILKHNWIDGCVYINPDNIAKEMFGDWNSPDSVIKAANYSQNLREELLLENKGILFETVFSSQEKVDFIKKAKAQGYFIRLFFVGTDSPAINAFRIARRVMEGGHDVPISKIISRYGKSIANCIIVSKLVNRLYVYDNSIENQDPILLFRTVDGVIKKQYKSINNWAEDIYLSCKE